MSSELHEIVQVGQDITSIMYYWVALTTILFYDYFLTLEDELQYAWKGKRSWAFPIFFLNRYLPLANMIWFAVSNFTYSYEMYQDFLHRDPFLRLVHADGAGHLELAQLALGVYLTNLAASALPQRFPPINLPEYRLCLFTRHPKVEIAYTAMSLIYDVLAFVVIAVLAVRSAGRDFNMPHLLRAIVQDSTVYFLVIFTSHFVLELMLLLARPSLQLLPAIGNVVYLPLMMNRLMLSLRKTANPPDAGGGRLRASSTHRNTRATWISL
ncbi:hypothetical protein BJ322DRAFT_299363 [Thelephora terrestris]|uniref:DUF6533 domain-containing protein n=1 Tax=Thelephora terrestris TaxID=56493 RepID=A0A9P6H6Y2_9AGAM|nr:hypothetical protein BJ322DRAFT_299363 [Thelephora terrestris]